MRAFAIGLLSASLFSLGTRLATLISQNTLWAEISFRAAFASLFAIGALMAWRRLRVSSQGLLFSAIAGTLSLPLVWLLLEWILPRAAPHLPALENWPRTFLWISVVHAILLLPVVPLLGASLSLTRRECGSSWPVLAGFFLGILLAGPWLRTGFAWPLDTLQLFPATAALVLAIEAILPPRKAPLIFLACCLILTALWPRSLLTESLQGRFGTLLALADGPSGISMVTDDANRGRLLRGPDGRATYAHGLQQEDRFLGHLPLLLHGAPQRILFLGRGSGHSVAAAGTHEGLEIVVRDRLGEPAHLTTWLPGAAAVSTPPRSATVACSPVTEGRFDVILLQPPMVTSQAFASCLSPEFLASIAEALAPDGIYAMKIDPGTLPVAELALLVTQLTGAFADVTIWAGQPASRWIAIASKQTQSPTLNELRKFWQDPEIGPSLRATGRATPFHLLAEFLMPQTTAILFGETFTTPGTFVAGIPARTAQHANSQFGFAAATSDDWTVAVLGGDRVLPDAFRRIFAQIERSEAWRQDELPLGPQPSDAALSHTQIDQIVASLRSASTVKGAPAERN
jgi:hypothetical protein